MLQVGTDRFVTRFNELLPDDNNNLSYRVVNNLDLVAVMPLYTMPTVSFDYRHVRGTLWLVDGEVSWEVLRRAPVHSSCSSALG